MTQEEYIEQVEEHKILVSSLFYNFQEDGRLLIPFTAANKIGFYNPEGRVVVKPIYSMCYGNCYTVDDYLIVSRPYIFYKDEGVSHDYIYYSYGVIDYKGNELIPVNYHRLLPAIGNKFIFSAETKDLQHGVINIEEDELIPFGKYEWLDGFCNGLSRVKLHGTDKDRFYLDNKWGIIDMQDNLLAVCDYIYPFYRNNKNQITGKIGDDEIIILSYSFGEGLFGCKKILHKDKNPNKIYYRYSFFNLDCKEIIQLDSGWTIVSGFKKDYAEVKSGVREGVIDKKGNITITHIAKYKHNNDYYEPYSLIDDGLDGEAEAYGNID